MGRKGSGHFQEMFFLPAMHDIEFQLQCIQSVFEDKRVSLEKNNGNFDIGRPWEGRRRQLDSWLSVFELENLMIWDRTNRPVWLRCTVGVLAAVIAAAIRLQFLEVLELRVTFLTFYPAVAVAALYGGFVAGLLATVVSAALANYFWMEPVGQFAIANSADLLSIIVFFASGALISYLAEATYRAQARAHKAEEQSRLSAERKHAEEELRESQSRLDLALRSARMGVWRLDLIQNKRHFDDQVCHLLGIDPAKFTGTEEEFYKAVHPDDREMLKGVWAQTTELGGHYEAEYRAVWLDGSVHYLIARGKMVHDNKGQPVRVNGLIWDITDRKQMEKELRESESRLRRFYESGLLGVIYWNMNGEITDANDKFLEMVGYDRDDLAAGRIDWNRMTPPEYRHLDERSIAELKATGVNKEPLEKEYMRKDGLRVPILVAGAMLDEANHNGVAFVLDITERKRTEETLRLSEEHYRSLFDNMLNGYAYCKMHFEQDRPIDFTYLNVNGAFETLTGLRDVVGRRVSEVIPGIRQSDPELFEAYGRVALTGVPERFETYVEALGMWFSISVYSPRKEHFVAVFDVITERKRTEEALQLSESRFRLLSGTAGRLLASQNPQRIVKELCLQVMEHLDCHAFFNFLVDELVGKLHLNACAGIPDEEARNIEWLDYGVAVCGCVAREGKRMVAEDIFNTPDIRTELVKSYGIQAYACHPLEVQGKLIGTLSFGTKTRTRFSDEDLTLMKTVADQVATAMEKLRLIEELRNSRDELELRVRERTAELNSYMAKLEQSNQALQDFASIAAHDLKEPLRKVNSFGVMLRQKYKDPLGQTGNDYLDRMLNATDRMQSLLAGLLDYSRVATASEPFEEVDLSDIIGEVLSDLEVRMVKTGGEVDVGTLPVVSADPTQMRQLFQNLIGNALKFHKPGEKPIVQVRSVSNTDAECRIVVEDNGIGFEEQYLEKIFAPFQKLHGRREFEGTGLGLAICKKIVERHGESITAGSTPGVGSKFVVTLPVRPRKD